MSVAASKHEQIAAALVSAFSSIVADGEDYNFTPAHVIRVRWWNRKWLTDEKRPLIIFVRPGQEAHREYATEQAAADMELLLLVCSKDARGSENDAFKEAAGSESGWQVENKAVRDVLRKIWEDVTLGGLADNLVRDSLIVDRAQAVAGWDVTEIRFVISYHYQKDAP